jgi:hypothetical protein
VTFEPKVDSLKGRKELLNQFEDKLGPLRLFNGSLLFLPFTLNTSKTNVGRRLSIGFAGHGMALLKSFTLI